MRIIKPGEPCPCCGQLIPEGLSRRSLLLLSYISEGLTLLDLMQILNETMELPAKAEPSAPVPDGMPPDSDPEVPEEKVSAFRAQDVGPMGRNSTEKREIMERLRVYRTEMGLGCWAAVVKASGGKLDDIQLREMCAGTAVLPVAEWRLAAKALDKLAKKAAANG